MPAARRFGHPIPTPRLGPVGVAEARARQCGGDLDGQHPAELGPHKLIQPLPVEYKEQRTAFAEAAS
jgi:hypothetical protein